LKKDSALNPIDRNAEILFGLFMALTFTGALSVATAGREEVRTMLIAALTCNMAWGMLTIGILFFCGYGWARYAGMRPFLTGTLMVFLGIIIEAVVIFLGG